MKQHDTTTELTNLTQEELEKIAGGSIWGDLAYLAGATLKCIHYFCTEAVKYQSTLPANLKK